MKSIEAISWQVWFSIETTHGMELEFVLDAADARAKRPTRAELCPRARTFTSYTEALWDMLDREFKSSTVRVREKQEYGTLSFLIEAGTPDQLQRAYQRCDKVAARWINKYRVNSMKANKE